MKNVKKIKILLTVLFIFLFFALILFAFSGENFVVLQQLFKPNLTKDEAKTALSGLGWRAHFTLGTLSMLQVVLAFLPAEPVQVIAGVTFGLFKGAAVCAIGVFVGNSVIYLLYRLYGTKLRDYFEKNIDFDFQAASRSKKVALVVLILYFLPAIPYGLICFFTASLRVKYPKYILLTTLGAIPSVLIGVGLGHIAMAASWTLSLCVFALLVLLLIFLYKNKNKVFAKVNAFIQKQSLPYSSKTTVKPYRAARLAGIIFGSRFVFDTKLKLRLNNTVGKLEQPALVLCNHGSFIDFVYAGRMLWKQAPHFVSARLYFFHKRLGGLLRYFGAFPKSMFSTDLENAKNCLRVLSSGGVLVMMPEARLSTVGKYEGIQPSTYKFIQRCNVAVYTIFLNGDYFAKPKWGDKLRRGSIVEATLAPLFQAGESKTLSLAEIQTRVDDALRYDEFAWLKTQPKARYKSKTLAEGLHNVLCICPECKKKYTMTTQGRTITCENCGFSRSLNDRYAFTNNQPFENFAQWYEWQTEQFKAEMLANPHFALEENVTLFHASKDGKTLLRESGKGVCRLDKNGLCYVGEEDGVNVQTLFPLTEIYRVLFGAGEDFEIYVGEELYYFQPTDKRCCVAWYIVSGLLKERYET